MGTDMASLTVNRDQSRPGHHFTVDVEEYFQVSAFEPFVARAAWETMETRLAYGVTRLLELLGKHGGLGTFFVLGWVADRHPEMIRTIAAAGHEIASHGWDHRRVTDQTPEAFRQSVRRTKALLESLTGARVIGFRAPSFSIVPGYEWALDVLLEEGYCYDSSLFPVRRRGYGYPGGRRDPHWIERAGGRLAELPPATLRRFGMTLPAGGGAYFRLFPYALVSAALRDSGRRGVSATFYIHPWELDSEQPRLRASWSTRIRHYGGLSDTIPRLERLLSDFQFVPLAETIAKL
jgi:polysaccharide deacetylase family protein (PEP-CTERM system associated)